jgi:hypothetical protein
MAGLHAYPLKSFTELVFILLVLTDSGVALIIRASAPR